MDNAAILEDGEKIKINLDDPAEFLKRKPKKSILKMKQDSSLEGKDGRAHFDEMNILATYHPADKDYGNMKIDEPKTPYHHSDAESEGDDLTSGSSNRSRRVSLGTAVDPEELAEGLAGGASTVLKNHEDSDSDEDLSDEKREHKREFEKKRKAHYNEGAALRQHAYVDDEEDGDVEMS